MNNSREAASTSLDHGDSQRQFRQGREIGRRDVLALERREPESVWDSTGSVPSAATRRAGVSGVAQLIEEDPRIA